MSVAPALRFAEEVLLLMLKDDTGYVVPIPEWRMACALAGSVLMDLALASKIDTDLETLTIVDSTPTGDGLLDPTLAEVAVAHHLELEMVPRDYKLRVNPFPKLSPDRRFKFRVARLRHPLEQR